MQLQSCNHVIRRPGAASPSGRLALAFASRPAFRKLSTASGTVASAARQEWPAAGHRRGGAPLATRDGASVFFVATESAEGFSLPLEPQQLLGLNPGTLVKDSDVNQAYDELLRLPIDPAYSQQVATGRAELLNMMRTAVITAKGRSLERRQRQATVPYDLLPACLALLAELYENDLVMYLGSELLATGELDSYQVVKSDVLLAMAQAKCNMARDEFEAGKQVVVGCKHLEEALALLQPKGGRPIAPDLAREIRASLAELNAQCALEQVSRPLSKEHAEERKHAVRVIREQLRQTDVDATGLRAGTGALPVTPDYAARLLRQLTCDEVVYLQEWELVARHAGTYKWAAPGLLERVAVAHILLGYVQCQPGYVKMAVSLMRHLPPSPDLLVAQAVCGVLLGSVQQSVDLLRQAEAAAAGAMAPPASRGAATAGGAQRHASPAEARGSPGPAGQLSAARAYTYVKDHTPPGDDGLLAGLCQFTEAWLAHVAMPSFRDTAAVPPPASLSRYFDNTHVEALIEVYDEKGGAVGGPGAVQGVLDAVRDGVKRVRDTAATSLQAAGALAAGSGPLDGLQDLSLSRGSPLVQPEARKLLPRAMLVAAVGALALAGVWAVSKRGAEPSAANTAANTAAALSPTAVSAARSRHRPVTDGAQFLEQRTAEALLKLWQEIKADALGPSHDSGDLGLVLAEPVLGEMSARVARFRAEGWAMKYRLHRIKVRDVEQVGEGGVARVLATLNESATLLDAAGQTADSYSSTYDAQYDIVKAKDGAWKLCRVSVLSQDGSA